MLHSGMKTMTVRDIRHHWPEAEKALGVEREIIITRDGKPVARLLPMEEATVPKKRFDPEAQRKWREEVFGKGVEIDTLKLLQEDREDRKLI
jgi:antitoxin (DNA-binding transcriptional repressor) of toxin-antitoxin stability system